MSDNTSKKTEEEMLDQTFGTYDEESTAQTTDSTKTDGSKKTTTTITKPKTNQNVIIGVVVGVLAIGVVGYKAVSGKQEVVQPPSNLASTPPTPPTPPVQPVLVVETPPPVAGPVVTSPVQPEATVTQVAQVDNSAAAQYLSGTNPLSTKTDTKTDAKTETKIEVTAPPETKVEVTTPVESKKETKIEVTTPVVTTPVDVSNNPNVVANNNNQKMLTNELKSLFDLKTQEFKGALDNIGNRVGVLERSISKQESANKLIEDRLSRLESGRATKIVKATESDNNAATIDNEVKEVKSTRNIVKHKKHHYHKEYVAHNIPRESSVLVDKTVTTRESVNNNTVLLHSVLGGRIWTKNNDGSLSTYTVGETLPSGEVIKQVDDSNFKVITDQRIISQ